MNPNSITEINEALKQNVYGTLEQLFAWKNSFTPSWFNTFKGVKLEELCIEDIAADQWLAQKVEADDAKACYVRYLAALQDINIIKFLSPYKEEKAKYEAMVPENQKILCEMLVKAAEAGIRPAKMELARQYRMGGFFEPDFAKALALLESLYEEEADPELLYQIGMIYFGGKGVEQNIPKAAEYLRRSGIDKGAMKVAGGPDLPTICRDYELCVEIKVVIGMREIASPVFSGILADYQAPTITYRDYPKTPEVVTIPVTPEILSINPYGYDLSTNLTVKGEKVLKNPLTLERLDSVEHITLDNFDKMSFYLKLK